MDFFCFRNSKRPFLEKKTLKLFLRQLSNNISNLHKKKGSGLEEIQSRKISLKKKLYSLIKCSNPEKKQASLFFILFK